MMFCARLLPNSWAMMRVVTSVMPPGGYGTTMRIGREGYLFCANAWLQAAASKAQHSTRTSGDPILI